MEVVRRTMQSGREVVRRKVWEKINRSPENAEFVVQAKHLKQTLKEMGIKGVTVSTQPEIRDASFFDRRRTMAFVGENESSVTILASSGAKIYSPEQPLTTMLILPTERSSGLLEDDKNNLYASSFWVCEDNTFKFINSTKPVPIDMLDASYNHKQYGNALLAHFVDHKKLLALSDNKHQTKELMKKAGIRVPEGVFIGSADEMDKMDVFLEENQGKELVVKANRGSQGKSVMLFRASDHDGAKAYADDLLNKGRAILVEERIIPDPAFYEEEPGDTDYNYRIITTLDPNTPKVIDGEIRYQPRDYDPVNISHKAKAVRPEEGTSPEIQAKINRVAEDATKVLFQGFQPREEIFGVVGSDLIVDEKENVYVLEVNTGQVGGFGTLAKLDKRPLSSIKDVMIPEAWDLLEKKFRKRREVNPQELREVEVENIDRVVFYDACIEVNNYERAQEILINNGGAFGQYDTYLLHRILTDKSRNYESVLHHVESQEDSPAYSLVKARMLRKLRRYDDAYKCLEENFPSKELLPQGLQQDLTFEKVCILLTRGGKITFDKDFKQSEIYDYLYSAYSDNGQKDRAKHYKKKAKAAKRKEKVAEDVKKVEIFFTP